MWGVIIVAWLVTGGGGGVCWTLVVLQVAGGRCWLKVLWLFKLLIVKLVMLHVVC